MSLSIKKPGAAITTLTLGWISLLIRVYHYIIKIDIILGNITQCQMC